MSLPKAILIGLLAFAAMSAAGYVTAELALQGDGSPAVTESGVTIVRSSLQGGLQTQSRALAQVTATPSPTPTATPEPSPTASPIPTATEPPPPLPTETPEPPTATPEPPTPTATPEPPPPTPTPTLEPPPPTPTPEPPAAVIAGASLLLGSVTPYSDSLAGSTLGCNGYGVYDPANPTVIAVGFEYHEEWPCGTSLGLCAIDAATGVVTTCIVGVRQDTCPGCAGNHLDVSRAAFEILCGAGANRCTVVITPLP